MGLLDGTKNVLYGRDEHVGGEMMGGKWMRQGNLKAMSAPKPYGAGTWQLFDVAADPGEANDLAQAMPEKLELLKAAWDEYARDVGVVPAE